MRFLGEVWRWFADGDNWRGRQGVPSLLLAHLRLSGLALALALVTALPVGFALGHARRFGTVAINIGNLGRALPSYGLLVLGVQLWGIATVWGTTRAALAALVALAIPPILVNAYVALAEVPDAIRDSARGMGMTGWQSLWRAELPVALPLVLAGVRIASLQVIATASIAAIAGAFNLGTLIVAGINVRDFPRVFAGALLVAVLALLVDGLFALGQRLAVSPGLRAR